MKRIGLFTILLIFTMPAVAANTGVYTVTTTPKNLGDLDHNKLYSWGINWVHTGEIITGATLKIFNIYD